MTESFDFRGLKCPLPALFARRALERASHGAEIEILTDDPMAPIDVPHMCRQEGFDVLAVEREGDRARIVLRRPIASASARGRDG
jgi:tRNA 2-thiouridine synthesizing protein A